jgi:hypothetical protein
MFDGHLSDERQCDRKGAVKLGGQRLALASLAKKKLARR